MIYWNGIFCLKKKKEEEKELYKVMLYYDWFNVLRISNVNWCIFVY